MMAQFNAPIVSLPNEVLQEVCRYLDPHTDVLRLSTTCNILRQKLSALAFQTIRLTTDPLNAASIQLVSESPLRHFVHRLEYKGKLARDPDSDKKTMGWVGYDEDAFHTEPDEEDFEAGEARILEVSDDSAFPPAVGAVLSNLARFPQLATLSITFRTAEEDNDFFDPLIADYYGDVGLVEDVDDWPCTLRSPRRWQRVVARSYHAIAANGALPSLASLELPDCLPVLVPEAWESDGWRKLLSRLDRFEWSTKRWQRSSWYEFCQAKSWESLEQQLNKYFFSQLHAVEELHLEGNRSGPLNLVPEDEESLMFGKEFMPCLRKLELHTTMIGSKLTGFMISKIATLQQLTLIDCFGNKEVKKSRWGDMFDALKKSGMPHVTEFILQDNLIAQWYHRDVYYDEDNHYRACEIGEFKKKGKVLPYARWNDQDYQMDYDDEKTLSRLRKGLDLKALSSFVELVESNKERTREA